MDAGIRFGDLVLTNRVLFDRAVLDLDYRGITMIRGHNKNVKAVKNEESTTSNGSGKSLLTSSLADPFYQVRPTVLTNKVQAKKDGWYRKGGRVDLDVSIAGTQMHIGKYNKSASKMMYDIHDGEKFLEHTTATSGEEWIAKNWPLSEEQFYSTCYLDGSRENPLTSGNSLSRFNYFSSLVNLDGFDEGRETIIATRNILKEDRIRLDEIASQIETLRVEIKAVNKKLGKDSDDTIKERLGEWIAENDRAQKRVWQIRELKPLLKFHDPKRKKKDAPKVSRGEAEKIIARADSALKDHRRYDEWEEDNKKTQKLVTKLDSEIDRLTVEIGDIGLVADLEKLKKPKQCRDIRLKIDDLIDDQEVYETDSKRLGRELESARREIKPLEDDLRNVGTAKQIEKAIEGLREERSKLKADLDRIKRLDGDKCPLCEQAVDVKHLRDERASAKRRIKELSVTLDRGEKKLTKRKNYTRLLDQMVSLEKDLDETKKPKMPAKLSVLEKMSKRLSKLEDVLLERSDLKVKDAPVERPKAKVDELKSTRKKAEKALDVIDEAKETDLAYKRVRKSVFESMEVLAAAVEDLASDESKIDTLKGKISEVSRLLEDRKRITKQGLELRTKADKLTERTKRIQVLDGLALCFGNTGIRRSLCEGLAHDVERYMNEASSLIFAEGYKFHFNVTETRFDIMYEDKRGIFDVRLLSAAERRCWTTLSMLGVLNVLPSRFRTNILVLDEMEANLDTPALKKYANELIPALTELIDHVIVATPLKFSVPNSRVITVVKDGLTSHLEGDCVDQTKPVEKKPVEEKVDETAD